MSKFNSPSSGTKTTNLAGAPAYTQTSKLEVASILLTSFLKDQFYRTEKDTTARIVALVKSDPKFAARAAIFARKEFGMRSVTHLVAAVVASEVHGQPWVKNFLRGVIHRPDDVLEIIACYQSFGRKGVTNAMRKGLGSALASFSAYQLSKYRKDGAEISLIDAVNLLHPKANEQLTQLMKGTLPAADTWETGLSRAGQNADEAELDALKGAEWKRLIDEDKLGYFALLRNLRNILDHAADRVDVVVERLTDKARIEKSLVFPFRYMTALDVVKEHTAPEAKKLIRALSKAVDIACANVPKFEGRTLIALDESGSMASTQSMGKKTCAQIGGLFAATMVKAWGDAADLYTFDTVARMRQANADDSTLSLAEGLTFNGGGTDFDCIFTRLKNKYDRIIIISDMQSWVSGRTPASVFADYKRRTGANPRVFTFDLHGYGSMQFPEANVYALAGFSDKVFETMGMLDQDRNALVARIEQIEL